MRRRRRAGGVWRPPLPDPGRGHQAGRRCLQSHEIDALRQVSFFAVYGLATVIWRQHGKQSISIWNVEYFQFLKEISHPEESCEK